MLSLRRRGATEGKATTAMKNVDTHIGLKRKNRREEYQQIARCGRMHHTHILLTHTQIQKVLALVSYEFELQ